MNLLVGEFPSPHSVRDVLMDPYSLCIWTGISQDGGIYPVKSTLQFTFGRMERTLSDRGLERHEGD